MRKFIYFLLLFFAPGLVFAAECTLDQYVAGNASFKESCDVLNINTTTNIGNLGTEELVFADVEINDVTIEDLTFLNNVTTSRFIVRNSKVNLDNLRMRAKIVFFQISYIMDDDLSGLANDTVLENLTLDNCWLHTLETIEELKNLENFTSLSITANRYLHLNLDPIMELPNLTTVNLNYMQHNVSHELHSYLREKNITVPGVGELTVSFGKDALPITTRTDYDIIRNTAISMVESYSLIETERDVKTIVDALGERKATTIEYALAFSYWLQYDDFKTAHVLGHESGSGVGSSIYVMVYYDNRWNVIDIVGLEKNPTEFAKLKNGENTDLFMQPASAKFTNGSAMDEKIIDYMDYSYYVGYTLPEEQLRIQTLPLNTISYSLLEPEIEGYVFHGWYFDEYFTKPISNVSEINKNLILYGKFEKELAPPIVDDGNKIVPPDTGMFMGIWIILPIVSLIAIEWVRNKRFNSLGGI